METLQIRYIAVFQVVTFFFSSGNVILSSGNVMLFLKPTNDCRITAGVQCERMEVIVESVKIQLTNSATVTTAVLRLGLIDGLPFILVFLGAKLYLKSDGIWFLICCYSGAVAHRARCMVRNVLVDIRLRFVVVTVVGVFVVTLKGRSVNFSVEVIVEM